MSLISSSFENAGRTHVTIFEGSDCCGKTTQAKKLLSNNKKSECRIYIHFPRAYYNDVKKLYTDTMSTIYNNDFMSEIFLNNTTDEETKNSKYETLKKVLIDNIVVNAEEKISFLETLARFVMDLNTRKKDYINATLNEWCHQFDIYEIYVQKDSIGEKISPKNIEKFINECNLLPLHFILDRFDYSGQCYNLFIIQKVLEKYRTENNSDKIDNLIFTLTEVQNEKTKEIETWKFFYETMGGKIKYIFFKPSKRIEDMVMIEKVRETDEYDNCKYIREYGKTYFEKLTTLISENNSVKIRNSLIINSDTDSIECAHPDDPTYPYLKAIMPDIRHNNKELIANKIAAFARVDSYANKYEQSKINTKVFTK